LLAQLNSSLVPLLGSAFQKRLFAFAQKRDIDIARSDWENQALRTAAEEHPDLREPTKRGRPTKVPNGRGLFPEVDEWEEAVRKIDEINDRRRSEGKKPLSTRKIVEHVYPTLRLPVTQETALNKLSRARQASGRRRPNVTKKD